MANIFLKESDAGISASISGIFWTFFRIGLLTFGGGLAMSSVMRHELVIRRKWINDSDFLAMMSLATVVPGVIAVNIAFLLGRRLCGKAGSAAAVLGTILPSFFVIILAAGVLMRFFDYPKVAAFFRGCAAAVAGQLAFAGYVFSKGLLKAWQHFVVCGAGIAAVAVFGLHPIWALAAAGIIGYWLCPVKKISKQVL